VRIQGGRPKGTKREKKEGWFCCFTSFGRRSCLGAEKGGKRNVQEPKLALQGSERDEAVMLFCAPQCKKKTGTGELKKSTGSSGRLSQTERVTMRRLSRRENESGVSKGEVPDFKVQRGNECSFLLRPSDWGKNTKLGQEPELQTGRRKRETLKCGQVIKTFLIEGSEKYRKTMSQKKFP